MNFLCKGMWVSFREGERNAEHSEKLSESWEGRKHEKETQNNSVLIVLGISWSRDFDRLFRFCCNTRAVLKYISRLLAILVSQPWLPQRADINFDGRINLSLERHWSLPSRCREQQILEEICCLQNKWLDYCINTTSRYTGKAFVQCDNATSGTKPVEFSTDWTHVTFVLSLLNKREARWVFPFIESNNVIYITVRISCKDLEQWKLSTRQSEN